MVPLVGNFVVMAWNFVTTLVSIPLARVLTMRQLFLGASLVASVSCLLLCGVPVYPGVADKNVKNGVAITGIAVFIAAFEIGLDRASLCLPRSCSHALSVREVRPSCS
ncbi:hexose transporter [Trypanosoma cruzi]|nr:hexose transporter [Trypanosoma cruzi]